MTADNSGKKAAPATPKDLPSGRGTDRLEMIVTPKPPKLSAEKLTPEEQKRCFIEAAR